MKKRINEHRWRSEWGMCVENRINCPQQMVNALDYFGIPNKCALDRIQI